MKKYIFLSFAWLLLLGCDKVDQPLVNYVPPAVPQRKVLLEDYTGHKCGNCPRAAEVIQKMHEKYGDNLVVVSIHAGDFAKTDADYTASYTTTPGNDWNMHYIGLAGAYPAGAVNRKNYAQNIIQFSVSKWSSIVEAGFKDEYILDLDITPSFAAEDRLLNVTVKGKFKKNYDRNINVSVVLTEDSIISKQVDYAKGPIENYAHMHMLREAVNGSWGTPFTTRPMAAADSISVGFSNFSVKMDYRASKMSVVAFVFDAETREVLEVEKVKMTGKTGK